MSSSHAVFFPRFGDDQVIHVHVDDEMLLPPSSRVEHMLGGTLGEAEFPERRVELCVLGLRSLPQLVESFVQLHHLVFLPLDDEPYHLCRVDHLRELTVEEDKCCSRP